MQAKICCIASADWMDRLFSRVETWPDQSPGVEAQMLKGLQYYLRDNSRAWFCSRWQLPPAGKGEETFIAQQTL